MAEDLDLNDTDSINATDPIVRRAHKRFKQCQIYETDARKNWEADYKFANGDIYNNYQWPVGIYQDRGARPSLTVNEVREHNLHVMNEARQHKTEVKYRPTGGGSTEAAAEVYEGLYRAISNASNAQMAQTQASGFQIQAGLGWTLVETDYVEPSPKPGPDAFNQQIRIVGISNPLSVYLDCDCRELDGTGARYGFVFEDAPVDEIVEEYPDLRGKLAVANAVDGEDAGWIADNHARKATYYEVTEEKDELLGDDEGTVVYASDVPAQLQREWEAEHEARGSKLKRRDIIRKEAHAHLIIGNDVIKSTKLPCPAIPLIPWVGEVTLIDKRLDRKGHTRAMISAQQMVNYNWSASVEYGALQGKSPWLAAMESVEGFETYFENANLVNSAWMPWQARSDDGQENPKPERIAPPVSAPVYLEGVQLARQFMMSASGQYESELGKPGNEKSGTAINQRQRQGDRATYHFIDNQALAIRRQGTLVQMMIPEVYDTARAARIIGLDGEEAEILVRPDATKAHEVQEKGAAIQRIFNPKIGTYAVISDVGPDYATQRQEAFNAIVQILTHAPQLISIIGDLLFKVADFPLAEEIADRLKPGLTAEAFEQLKGQLAKATAAGANTQKLLRETSIALIDAQTKEKNYASENEVKAFDAETKRLAALQKMLPMDQEGLTTLIHQTVGEAMQIHIGPIVAQLTQAFKGGTADASDGPSTSAPPVPISSLASAEPLRTPSIGPQTAAGGA